MKVLGMKRKEKINKMIEQVMYIVIGFLFSTSTVLIGYIANKVITHERQIAVNEEKIDNLEKGCLRNHP